MKKAEGSIICCFSRTNNEQALQLMEQHTAVFDPTHRRKHRFPVGKRNLVCPCGRAGGNRQAPGAVQVGRQREEAVQQESVGAGIYSQGSMEVSNNIGAD